MSQHTVPVAAITGAVVSPYRFSQQPAAMIEFIGLIGLSVTVRRHDYAILHGKGGRVAVHPVATAGNPEVRTSLTFEVPDAVAATEQLTKAGLEASWWDEAWGRQARVSGPTGQISLNAEMEDFHGYQVSDPGPSPVTVVAVVFTDEMDVLTDFFGRFGFARGGDEAPGWRPLRAEVGQGVIGCIRPDARASTPTGISLLRWASRPTNRSANWPSGCGRPGTRWRAAPPGPNRRPTSCR